MGRLGAPGHHVVLYETLTADPEAVLRPLLAALDLDWQPTMLTGYAAAADGVVASGESWKIGVGRKIRPSATAGLELDAAQRERVTRSLRRDLYEAAASGSLGGRGG